MRRPTSLRTETALALDDGNNKANSHKRVNSQRNMGHIVFSRGGNVLKSLDWVVHEGRSQKAEWKRLLMVHPAPPSK